MSELVEKVEIDDVFDIRNVVSADIWWVNFECRETGHTFERPVAKNNLSRATITTCVYHNCAAYISGQGHPHTG